MRLAVWLIVILFGCTTSDSPVVKSQLISKAGKWGSPRHVAFDAIAKEGKEIFVRGKFAYGKISKDLEGEPVQLELLVKDQYRKVAETNTDSDGRAVATLVDLPAGMHRYRWRVLGDSSTIAGQLFVIKTDAKVVIFDIDATLTTSDSGFFKELVGVSATARKGASNIPDWWKRRGFQPLYITGRHYSMHHQSRKWLKAQGMPDGPLFTTQSWRNARPAKRGVGAFKSGILEMLDGKGIGILAAYGNAATDVCAYMKAPISKAKVFILDKENIACEGGDKAIFVPSYPKHLEWLKSHLCTSDSSAVCGKWQQFLAE